MVGTVDSDGVPTILLAVAAQTWRAIVDTGFNGDVELPESLRPHVNARFKSRMESLLASSQSIIEDYYRIDFPFDGQTIEAEATFAPGGETLLGTHLMRNYRLEINFVNQTVLLERLA